MSCCLPPRSIVTVTCWPGFSSARTALSASVDGVLLPSTATMTSPGWIPAAAAGPPGVTSTTPTPAGCPDEPTTVVTRTPRAARPESVTVPVATSWSAMRFTWVELIAKPMPGAAPPLWGSTAASVGMPTTCPWRSTRAPPLLPGLMAADVWMASGNVAPGESAETGSVTVRPVAEMIPFVTVAASPRGLPMASTISPTRALVESANVAGLSPWPPETRITARSLAGNEPTSVAGRGPGEPDVSTWNCLSDPVTCALVTTSPLSSYTTPEPRPVLLWISTTEGSTSGMTRSYSDPTWSVLAAPVAPVAPVGPAVVAEPLAKLEPDPVQPERARAASTAAPVSRWAGRRSGPACGERPTVFRVPMARSSGRTRRGALRVPPTYPGSGPRNQTERDGPGAGTGLSRGRGRRA